MLYNFLAPHADDWWGALNIFRYLSVRSLGAILCALTFSLIVGGPLIRTLQKHQKKGQPIRDDGPTSHLLTKKGTPTMGGLLILLSLTFTTLLWCDLRNSFVWITLLVTVTYGLIGFIDDYLKVKHHNSKGMPGRAKLCLQVLLAGIAAFCIQQSSPPALQSLLSFPLIKDMALVLGAFYLPFAIFVIIGSSNAVNLTDGLDGLATGPSICAALALGIIAYVVGNVVYAAYLNIPHIVGTGELTVFASALVGSCIGFLWFNTPPARVFMGDTGSLAIGAALGTIAVIIKHEITLAIIGGLFVLEAVSVIIQVAYFKLTKGKRIFLMAPLHHHFEKKGWSEPTIVMRFWIIAFILALIGIATLKIR